MSYVLAFVFFALCNAVLSEKPAVEPEYLDFLRATGRDQEFADLMGIDVSLVRPQEGRSEEDVMFTTVSELGDILLTAEQKEQARQGILFEKNPEAKWPNDEIPYVFAFFNFIFPGQRRAIREAIASFNNRTSKLKIVPRNGQSDYVYVMDGNGCYSYLGKTGGAQPISLQSLGCLSTGTIQHEFIHAAGFAHEHNRPDRDDYVEVLWENIPPQWRSQYEKVSSEDFGNQEAYDHYSVMHYPYNAPDSNKPAFRIFDESIDPSRLGQRDGPTETDIKKVDTLYP